MRLWGVFHLLRYRKAGIIFVLYEYMNIIEYSRIVLLNKSSILQIFSQETQWLQLLTTAVAARLTSEI